MIYLKSVALLFPLPSQAKKSYSVLTMLPVLVFPKEFEFQKFVLHAQQWVFLEEQTAHHSDEQSERIFMGIHGVANSSGEWCHRCLLMIVINDSDIGFLTTLLERIDRVRQIIGEENKKDTCWIIVGSCGTADSSNYPREKVVLVENAIKYDRMQCNPLEDGTERKQSQATTSQEQENSNIFIAGDCTLALRIDKLLLEKANFGGEVRNDETHTIWSGNLLVNTALRMPAQVDGVGTTKAKLFDMETYEFFWTMRFKKISKYYAIRFVTDIIGGSMQKKERVTCAPDVKRMFTLMEPSFPVPRSEKDYELKDLQEIAREGKYEEMRAFNKTIAKMEHTSAWVFPILARVMNNFFQKYATDIDDAYRTKVGDRVYTFERGETRKEVTFRQIAPGAFPATAGEEDSTAHE